MVSNRTSPEDASYTGIRAGPFGYRREPIPSGRRSGDEERFEHLTHFRQLIMGLKAARVG